MLTAKADALFPVILPGGYERHRQYLRDKQDGVSFEFMCGSGWVDCPSGGALRRMLHIPMVKDVFPGDPTYERWVRRA